jgi:DDE superfamily endonuclease
MSARRPCPPAPGPLEDYAQRFDPLFSSLAQRRGLRDYLQGLLLPRDRNKTLTGLAGAEPITGAQHREVQRLQWFLSESAWDHEQANDRRVQLLCEDPVTAPHRRGVLVIDDTGDRKDGSATAHVARQYLGSVGKIDNGIVAVTSLWADERCYWPVHAVPYTPASRLLGGERDPGFRTKPQLAVELVQAAQQASVPFQAVVADCAYGDNPGFTDALGAAGVPFVLALKPRKGTWAPAEAAHTPVEAAGDLGWQGSRKPGRWRRVTRRFRDGHTETWWAADAQLGGWGPHRRLRLVATTDPARLPGHSSWYLLTNLPRPAGRRAQQANLAEVVRLYGLRNWVEQGYKQVKSELGWADPQAAPTAARGAQATGHRRRTSPQELVAGGVASGGGLADPMQRAGALLAVVVASAAAPAAAAAA